MRDEKSCPDLSQRDSVWHGSERHDSYCLRRLEWCPDCDACEFNKDKYEDE